MKQLKDLDLMDRFLFAEAMEDPEFVELVLEIILGKEITLKQLPQAEKEERKQLLSKQIRLDVWAADSEGSVYDTEVQKRDTKNLPKRSRYYQGVIDSKLLEAGTVDYNKLNDSYIIIIAPFDLFGKGLYRYTFHMSCDEIADIKLEDGATRIFLNTRGTNPEGVTQELIDLLHYFEHTTSEIAEQSASKNIQKMQEKITCIRFSEERGIKYMNAWEEKILDRQEAHEEGRKQGLEQGRLEGHAAGLNEGRKEVALKMKQKGLPASDIFELTGLSQEEIETL